jgi:hypothetical protein
MRLVAAIVAATLAVVGTALGGEQTSSPSIVYYGEGANNQVSEGVYWAGQQGHVADEAKERKRATDQNAIGYGAISTITGNPRTNFVKGYTRSDGVKVRSYYRSKR